MILEDKLGSAGDAAYSALMDAHEDLSEAESHALNARLVLMLMNEVGDTLRLRAIFDAARALARD